MTHIRNALILLGAAAIVLGCWMAWPPLALIVAGLGFSGLGFLGLYVETLHDRQDPRTPPR